MFSHTRVVTMWLFNSSPWKDPPIFKFGRPSISMGHLYHDYVSHNQRVYIYINYTVTTFKYVEGGPDGEAPEVV